MPGSASRSLPPDGRCMRCSSEGKPRPPRSRMLLIDVHNHFYPPEYLDALKRGDSEVKLTIDSEGNPCIHYPGDYNVAVQGHRDIEYRQGVLEKEGVDTQIITFTTPGTHVETPERAIRFATLVNDAFAKIHKE